MARIRLAGRLRLWITLFLLTATGVAWADSMATGHALVLWTATGAMSVEIEGGVIRYEDWTRKPTLGSQPDGRLEYRQVSTTFNWMLLPRWERTFGGVKVELPVIDVILLLLALLAFWCYRDHCAKRAGLCRRCRYDMRSTPGEAACPECGLSRADAAGPELIRRAR